MFKTVKRIIDWCGEFKGRLYAGFVVSFFSHLFTALPIMLAAYTIGLLLQSAMDGTPFDTGWVWKSLILLLVLVFLRFLFDYLRTRFQEAISYELVARDRLAVGDALKRVSLGYFQQVSTGNILNSLTTGLGTLEGMGIRMIDNFVGGYLNFAVVFLSLLVFSPRTAVIALAAAAVSLVFLLAISHYSAQNAPMETTLAHLFPEMTANIAAPVLTILYLFVLDWRLALLSLVVFPVAFFFMMTVMGGYGKDYAGAVQATTEMSTTLIEYINGIEVIKAFNQGSKSYAKLTDKVRYNAQYYVNWMKKSQLGMAMAYGFFPAQMLTILPVGWLLYLHGSLAAETFLTVIVLALGMAAPIVAAFNFVDTLAQVGTTVGQVDEILNAEEQQHSTTPVTFAGHDIVLDHVSFDYHEDKEILHDVSLSIPAGRMTALVGPSGSGKSTIAKLAAGFWDVKTGSITLGGRDLKDIPLQQLYEQTAFVSQDNYLFDDTVRENIRMGRLNATDAEVEAAAHAAGCDSFIGELEHGYDTMVGGGGAHLSGGEKQRISIARAMLKDAPIVILDEATANVDPENEDRLQKAIEALTRDKTIIMIAHRLKTVRHADQILVVDHGRIVQQGTHEQLIGQPGIYAAFVGGRKQAEGWKL